MRKLMMLTALAALTTAAPALGDETRRSGDAGPWWMDQPIIASLGMIKAEIPANRAQMSASFQVVDRQADDASQKAMDKVRLLGEALSALGAGKVIISTGLTVQPIYAQYRDKDGNLINNQRADRIDNYSATASISVEVRDVSVVERAFALILAAEPTSTGHVSFSLEPDNATRTRLFTDAVANARARAEGAAAATGAKLGAVKLIDPTGRACDTDVLITGSPNRGYSEGWMGESLSYAAPPPPPPPPPPAIAPAPSPLQRLQTTAQSMTVTLQPPMMSLTKNACVIYSLAG